MNQQKGITLIGMSGVGKSTIGKLVAKHLDFDFVDLDLVIKEKEREPHSVILKRIGDEKFLKLEERHALAVPLLRTVFSPGGSIVYLDKAMERLKNETNIFYLQISLAELTKRIGIDQNKWERRGIVGLREKGLDKLFYEREPLYAAAAHYKIPCEGLSDKEVAESILAYFS